LEVPPDVNLDRKPIEVDEDWWSEAPQKKFERFLYEANIPLGLIYHGTSVRLVYRPEGQQSGYISFPLDALLKPAGRLACSALRALLNHDRLHRLPGRQRLHHILAESRKYQNEVSTQLAEQVLAALFELLKGFEAADEESRGQLLRGLRDRADRTHEIYEGLLTVLMRLVFLLYAEEREMFPADELFVRNYALSGLFARLVEDEGHHPDTMDQRYGAWAQLISLFRMVYGGTRYQTAASTEPVAIPARHGDLFKPERFPFLEGRADRDAPAHLPRVPDGTILNVLRNLLYLKEERLSYRSLEVEQIGSVYEAVMGYRVETATGRSVAIRPEKRHGAPITIDLDALLALAATQRGKRFKALSDRTLPKAAGAAVRDARNEAELVAALDRLIDRRLTPAPVPAGSLVFQPSPERRRTGSHYTPRSLTKDIVARALKPILDRLGPSPAPDDILALKICDPAMGSGAFLIEAMRLLARLLCEAWSRSGGTPRIPGDETPDLFACRLIAQRCLYGVDKNRMAVDLAKLSFWLATLAKDHSFTFLDHNLRHGDSLVGLSLAQLEACHWSPDAQQAFVSQSLRQRLNVAIQKRREIMTAGDLTSYEKLNDLRAESETPLELLRVLGNAVLGTFFEGGTATARERRRSDLSHTIRDYLDDKIDMPTRLALRGEIEQSVQVLRRLEPFLPAFHWEIEFPEVFLETASDGSIRRREAGGFDVMVGNPPFAGKNTIAEAHPPGFLDWLKTLHPESHGNADLVAHFFRRAFDLIRQEGSFGLIATNTIGQGDTRSTGLRWICNHGGTIFAARKRLRWPGDAAVVVSVVHGHKGPLAGPYDLNGRIASLITAYLFYTGGNNDPARLHANAGKSFVGSYVLGMGFTFDDTDRKGVASPITKARADELARSGERPTSMEELIAKNPRNRELILPYIGGKEVNDSPTQTHHRYVINFEQMSEAEARRWPDLMKIVEEKVKGTRASHSTAKWWHFERLRPELYEAVRGLNRVLVISRVGQQGAFTFLPNGMVYSEQLIAIADERNRLLALLQSRPHEIWTRFFASSMKDDLRYTPSDCFETFPFPSGWNTGPLLESVGKDYHEHRAQLMRDSNKGLTKTYNRFHDPKERSPEIRRLRELHTAMDRAVMAAYGWSDIDTNCGFDLDWCEAEPADDASLDTLERIETGHFFFESSEEAR
ncbi:MAG TPA: DNA methyltransferase, partial [Isosphaeraceae bacterium]|nr:DNA methyltransferase [Isosphaeraceae bacterium]